MTSLRTIRLVVHPGRSSSSWGLVLRTDDGRSVFDRRLQVGFFDHELVPAGIADVSDCLRRIADEIDRRVGADPSPEAAREPRGAVGGGTDHRPGRVCAHSCPACGEHLDGMPSDD